MLDKYLERQRERARRVPRPVYRFATDRYECPFCGTVFCIYENEVYKHMETCPKRPGS